MATTPTTLGTAVPSTSNLSTLVFTTGTAIPNNSTVIGFAWFRDIVVGNQAVVNSVTSTGLTWNIDETQPANIGSSGGVGLFSAQVTNGSIATGYAISAVLKTPGGASTSLQRSNIWAIYLPGLWTFDKGHANSANSSSPTTGATAGLAVANEIVFGVIAKMPNASDAASAVGGWTELVDSILGSNSYLHSILAWQNDAAAATPSYNPTTAIASNYAAVIGAYQTGSVTAPTSLTAPTISGTPQVGMVMTSDGGTWNNGGDAGMTLTYQWQHNTGTSWASCTGSGNTTLSYTANAADLGFPLRMHVTAINSASTSGVKANSVQSAIVAPATSVATVTVTANVPTQNQQLAGVTNLLVAVTGVSTVGNIASGSVKLNGGTSQTLAFDGVSQRWTKQIAIPIGASTAIFTLVDNLSNTGTLTVNFSNANTTYPPPSVLITQPTEGQDVTASSQRVTADVASQLGIALVEISVDNGVTWQPMTGQ